jgi:hypothetical protein
MPRWRILCPFSTELAPALRHKMMARVNGLLGGILAPESFTLSQSYFYGRLDGGAPVQVESIDGDFLDLRHDLDAGAIGKTDTAGATTGVSRPTTGANVVPLIIPGQPPAVLANRQPATLTTAAQANLPAQGWFGMLPPARMNDCLRAIATHPATIARSEINRLFDGGWLHSLWGLADAARLGATEAKEIADTWAQTCSRCAAQGFADAWNSFSPDGGKGIGSLIKFATEDGVDLARWRDAAHAATTTTVVCQGGRCHPDDCDPGENGARRRALGNEPAVRIRAQLGGEALIAHIQSDGGVEAIDERQLLRSLANRQAVVPTGTDKTTTVPLGKWWLTRSQRREVDRVVFDPERKLAKGGEKTLNLWTGLARQPIQGRWRLMASHLFTVICRRNRADWRYLIQWMAHAVQHPGTAPGSVIVLRSTPEARESLSRSNGWL